MRKLGSQSSPQRTRLGEQVQPLAVRHQARGQRQRRLRQPRAALDGQHLAAGEELPAAGRSLRASGRVGCRSRVG